MGRPRKDNVPVSFRLERTVFDKLNQFCEDSGQAKTVAIERALGMYIDDYYMKQEQLEKINILQRLYIFQTYHICHFCKRIADTF